MKNQEVYEKLSRALSPKRFDLYKIIYLHGPISRHDIDEQIRMLDRHYISSRSKINELVTMGIVKKASSVICGVTKRQILLFDVTGTLPVDSVKRKTHAQMIRELEDRLLLAEKVLLGIQRMSQLTKNGQPLEAEIQKYRHVYPEDVVRFKTRSQKGLSSC